MNKDSKLGATVFAAGLLVTFAGCNFDDQFASFCARTGTCPDGGTSSDAGPGSDGGPGSDAGPGNDGGPGSDGGGYVLLTATAPINGTILGADGGILCGALCQTQVPFGSSVTLSTYAMFPSGFTAWTGDCASAGSPGDGGPTGSCTLVMDRSRSVGARTAQLHYNYVFATSAERLPSFGGLDGGDALCASAALDAGLPGHYVALLRTSASGLTSRLADAGARGWMRVDQRPFADDVAGLFNNLNPKLLYPPMLDEHGAPLATNLVWTGGPDGTSSTYSCSDWTDQDAGNYGSFGTASAGSSYWYNASYWYCDTTGHIYCFETDYNTPLSLAPPLGRRMFVSTPVVLDAGVAQADALCSADAQAAGLAGTFQAFLATTQASALSRFSTTGAPWFRVDGVQLVSSASDLANTSDPTLLAAPSVTANGTYIGPFQYVWTGANLPDLRTVVADGGSDCLDWTSNDGGVTGQAGDPGTLDGYLNGGFFAGYPLSCSGPPSYNPYYAYRVYCFEP